ncbi:aspartate racemase [Burkholderia sp. WAC0059]|uniref:aspartate/glutamate racemase family protein n=1 Tax=Burkholderia sp. WAC0059 TaxID=2066022 RepID=UPI000C7F54E2|nr:amino acid racemase [Burkholderia sp. WAC0059]PLZ00087.1 aspartate racemase [Burkholderia sp. WAC0059]
MALIGILGGMGPLATADFFHKLVKLTSVAGATCDQQHLPLLVANLPHIPDRSQAMLGEGPDPLPALIDGIDMLNRNSVDLIVMPCNSAHYWYDALRGRTRTPMLHIAEVCVSAVSPGARHAAVLATGGTLSTGLYQRALSARGIEPLEPAGHVQAMIDACIRAVKADSLDQSAAYLAEALDGFARQGADVAVMGCTEIPLAAERLAAPAIPLVDSTLELARATVSYALARGWDRPA